MGYGAEILGEAARQVGCAVLESALGCLHLLCDGCDLLVGQLFQAVVLRTLLGYLADGPVCAAVVRDPEARGLLIGDAADVKLLELLEGGSRQGLGLLSCRAFLGSCCLLFCGDGRVGFITHGLLLLSVFVSR